MAYKLDKWTLYRHDVKLKDGKTITVYYFSVRAPQRGTPCDLPEGYSVGVNKRKHLSIFLLFVRQLSIHHWKKNI
jgi:hypothetical protein